MGAVTSIEWSDASWTAIRARNLKTGKIGWHCEHVTTGCEHCYSETLNKVYGTGLPFKPGHLKDIEVFLDEKMLIAPLRWRRPRRVFVCSMTDLFADFVTDEMIDRVFAVMALCPQHTFQVLTKRPERMRDYMTKPHPAENVAHDWKVRVSSAIDDLIPIRTPKSIEAKMRVAKLAPLPNVWLGTSCERQQEADERIPVLLDTPAAIRFVSLEPLLGRINLSALRLGTDRPWDALRGRRAEPGNDDIACPKLDQVIVGGESGKAARPMHPQWARDLRDQCHTLGIPFFFKQHGEWTPVDAINISRLHALCGLMGSAPQIERDWVRARDFLRKAKEVEGTSVLARVGKKLAGRTLDGRTWDEFPEIRT